MHVFVLFMYLYFLSVTLFVKFPPRITQLLVKGNTILRTKEIIAKQQATLIANYQTIKPSAKIKNLKLTIVSNALKQRVLESFQL